MYTTIGAFLGESENSCTIVDTRVATQDSFKQAILSEPDVEKHIAIIDAYTAKEAELFAKYQAAVEKSIKEKEKEDKEEKEDDKKVKK